MNPAAVNTTFALLALIANILTVGLVIGYAVSRTGPAARERWAEFREQFTEPALIVAFLVALACTCGSLFLQFGEGLTPCDLCWFQRICMYPQTVVIGASVLVKDHWYVKRAALPLSLVGAVISLVHVNLLTIMGWFHVVQFPGCSQSVPCSVQPVTIWGFITIPYMALSGFLLIACLLLFQAGERAEEA